jgi:hypothetical protein
LIAVAVVVVVAAMRTPPEHPPTLSLSLSLSISLSLTHSLTHSEELYDSPSFAERELAALLASKVFYHLGDFRMAMHYALCAGTQFNVRVSNEFVDTLLSTILMLLLLLGVGVD